MKKLLTILFTILLIGNFYILKDNLISYQPKSGEFYDLKNRITQQEYRRLPSYLQTCYEKEN